MGINEKKSLIKMFLKYSKSSKQSVKMIENIFINYEKISKNKI